MRKGLSLKKYLEMALIPFILRLIIIRDYNGNILFIYNTSIIYFPNE